MLFLRRSKDPDQTAQPGRTFEAVRVLSEAGLSFFRGLCQLRMGIMGIWLYFAHVARTATRPEGAQLLGVASR